MANLVVGANGSAVGTNGDDQLFLGGTTDGVLARLKDGNDLARLGDGRDKANGGEGNDTIDGGGGNDRITGGEGKDQLLGGAGNDWLVAGEGSDRVNGGEGKDTIVTGGDGLDRITGGSEEDLFIFKADSNGQKIIRDFEVGTDEISLKQFGIDDVGDLTVTQGGQGARIEIAGTDLLISLVGVSVDDVLNGSVDIMY